MAMPLKETEIILTIRPRSLRNFRSREEAIFDFICWHNPPKTKLKEQQTHKTQRSVLAHFISCCPIPMGSVNAEEVKWTEGKKLQGGCGWCAGLESLQYRETASGNPWPVITSPLLSLLTHTVHSAVKWDMLLHFFDKFCGTLVPHTQLDNIISAKVCHKNSERIYATLKIEIYCKRNLWQMPKSKKKKY